VFIISTQFQAMFFSTAISSRTTFISVGLNATINNNPIQFIFPPFLAIMELGKEDMVNVFGF